MYTKSAWWTVTLTTELVEICDGPAEMQDLERACIHLLDWVGIVLATRGSAPARAFGAAAGLPGDALSGLTTKTPEPAAFALGALGSLLEMDDLHRRSILHAGDVVCPAALVAARDAGCSGPELLRALLAGYDVALRLGIVAASGGYTAWYNSSVCGVFGAAMAASRAMGLGPELQAHALGHAGMQAGGLWQCRLEHGHAKQLATGHAARAGVTAARAAQAGLAAPLEILEGPLGLFSTLYPQADLQSITETSQSTWLLHDVSLKPWSACRHTHPAIAAALDLRASLTRPPRTIEVATYAAALEFCDRPLPRTAHEARFSLQYCVAVALAEGAPTRSDFEDPALRERPEIAALRGLVTLAEDPAMSARFPGEYAARVSVTDGRGETWTIETPHAPGDPEAPLSPIEIETKFLANCRDGGVYETGAMALRDAILSLPQSTTLQDLNAALTRAVSTDIKG